MTCGRRQGNPLLSGDLLRVSVQSARAIIVVATDSNPDVSDARVLRTVLALMGEHDKLQRRLHHGLKARVDLFALLLIAER